MNSAQGSCVKIDAITRYIFYLHSFSSCEFLFFKCVDKIEIAVLSNCYITEGTYVPLLLGRNAVCQFPKAGKQKRKTVIKICNDAMIMMLFFECLLNVLCEGLFLKFFFIQFQTVSIPRINDNQVTPISTFLDRRLTLGQKTIRRFTICANTK